MGHVGCGVEIEDEEVAIAIDNRVMATLELITLVATLAPFENEIACRRELLHAEVVVIDPFRRLKVPAELLKGLNIKRVAPQSAICLGLAIRGRRDG